MNILIDILPEDVEIDGKTFEIRSDFRTSILFELLIQNDEISDEDKMVQVLMLYYPVVPSNVVEAMNKIMWFYRCGKDEEKHASDSEETAEKDDDYHRPIYSFEHDAEYIYSAFLQQYGIDLQDVEGLHWWKFKALFKCLDEKTEIRKIMGYRAQKITNDMSNKEKEFLRKMKKLYALPISKKEQEFNDKLKDALMHGGNVDEVMKSIE